MRNIVTIGWGNGHSHLLKALKQSQCYSDIALKSIVSMSDDGRTTGKLMKVFEEKFWIHLPPPGDLRRCIYVLSESPHVVEFQYLLEQTLTLSWKIQSYTLRELLVSMHASKEILEFLEAKNNYFLDFSLDISKKITGHKFWNIMMACLFQNFLYDYNYMVRFMHDLLDTHAQVIPVTTDSAFIEAILENGGIIKKQDHISNIAAYSSKISAIRLMEESIWAKHNFKIDDAILQADYIIISPWDLFTSNISNLIIWGINSLLRKSNAKIIYIWNTTNKGWETADYTVLDFVHTLEQYLWKQIDVLLVNDNEPQLWEKQREAFKNDISVKWGDYIYISKSNKVYLQSKSTRVIEADLLDMESLYKHDSQKLWRALSKILV